MHTNCMKCQILYSGEKKKNKCQLLAAESAQRVVMDKEIFQEK